MGSTSPAYALFTSHFGFRLPVLANIVGAGGKTSLILTLLEEFSERCSAIYTTTTRIHPPPIARGMAIISSDCPSLLKLAVSNAGRRLGGQRSQLVVTLPGSAPGFLSGVNSDFAEGIDREDFPVILNEADGARSMSIKFPREGEPVPMQGADCLIVVIGLDCLNKPLGPETLFRWELCHGRLGLRPGDPLTPELAAHILLHPDGVCKNWQPEARIVVFINKVDSASQDALASALAHALFKNRNFPVERVVWGSLMYRRADSLVLRQQ